MVNANTLALLATTLSTDVANAVTPSLCQGDEQVFFSCDIKKKTVSLCTSAEGARLAYMEYRFGTANMVELRYRGDALHPSFSRVGVSYASNAASIVWFRNQGTDYLLNFPLKSGPSLQLKRKGTTFAEMTCNDGWKSVVGDPEKRSPFIADKPDASPLEAEKYWRD